MAKSRAEARTPWYPRGVPQAFILNMYANDNSHLGQRKFSGLPIRVGRNALNDWQVAQSFVSDFHARIEEIDGQLAVRDLNSKNGIYVRQGGQPSLVRIASQVPVALRAHGHEFFVGPFLRIHVQAIAAGHDETLRDLKAQGSVLGNPQIMGPAAVVAVPRPSGAGATPAYGGPGQAAVPAPYASGPVPNAAPAAYPPAQPFAPSATPAPPAGAAGYPAHAPHLRSPSAPPPAPAYPNPNAGRAGMSPRTAEPYPHAPIAAVPTGPPELAPTQSSGGGPANVGAPHLGANAGSEPLAAQPTGPRGGPVAERASQPPHRGGGEVVRGTAHFSLAPESLALVGLRELATSLVPGMPLETTGDIARLITKLHDTVEVFCRCFVPLRESHAQFAASNDLQRASDERSLNRSSAYIAVERAQNPAGVAKALLDWRDASLDAPSAVEGIFADLVVYQTALLDGVMNGIRALLEELSPSRIEQLQDERRAVGVHLALGRYKALWESYIQMHEAVQQQHEVFARLFGPEFAAAYRERVQRGQEGGNTR